nr:MAG TPA: tail assembly chaperone protein [Caudoviricetes sp.]
MMILKVKGKEYKVKFGFNSFCDTDLMERTGDLLKVFQNQNVENDNDVTGIGKIKDLFTCVRELLYFGFMKYNPVADVQKVGDILDDYHDEATEENANSIMELFTKLTEELMQEGFLGDLTKAQTKQVQQIQEKQITEVK